MTIIPLRNAVRQPNYLFLVRTIIVKLSRDSPLKGKVIAMLPLAYQRASIDTHIPFPSTLDNSKGRGQAVGASPSSMSVTVRSKV